MNTNIQITPIAEFEIYQQKMKFQYIEFAVDYKYNFHSLSCRNSSKEDKIQSFQSSKKFEEFWNIIIFNGKN